MKTKSVLSLLLLCSSLAFADAPKKLYESNFEKAELDKVPDDFSSSRAGLS